MNAPPTTRRVLLRRAMLASLLSLLTLAATAWIMPQFTRMPSLVAVGPSVPGALWVDDEHGGAWVQWQHWSAESIDLKRIIFMGLARDQDFYGTNEPPWWARRISLDMREGFEEVMTVATGWPWRALAWERWITWREQAPSLQMIQGPDGTLQLTTVQPPSELERHSINVQLGSRRWILPTRVLWPGLAANLLVAWSAFALMLVAPLLIRRAHRTLTHRCVRCGYSLHGAERTPRCPECGAPLSAPIAPSSASSRS